MKNLLRDIRFWGLGKAAVRRVVIYSQRLFGVHLYKVGIRDLGESRSPIETVPALDYRLLSDSDLDQEADYVGMEIKPGFIRDSVDRGEKIVGAFDATRFVGYAITANDAAPHIGAVWVRFGSGYSYLYKLFVHPDYRGKRIGPAIVLQSDEVARANGFTHGLTFISVANFSSLQLRGRVPGEPAGYAGFVMVGSFFWSFATSRAKKVGFEFVKR